MPRFILPGAHRYGPMGAGVWTPAQLGDRLRAWWDPTFGVTKDPSTQRVSDYADRVGAVSAVQPSGASQPLWTPDTMAGRPALYFDAARLLQDASLAQAVAFPLTYVVVAKIDAARNYGRLIGKGDGSSPGGLDYNATGYLYIYNGSEGRLTLSLDTASPHLYIATYNGAASTGSIDGAAPTTFNPGTSISSIQKFDIGGSKGAPSVRHNGYLGDILVISGEITTDERAALWAWARAQWRL